jgi:uncharacterized protein (DUF1501 family)
VNRRGLLQLGASGLAALWLTEIGRERRADAGEPARPPARADACVVLWLNGGPSHLDTFDPKPGSRGGGPFRAIATRARGVELSQHLPRLAEGAHRFALVRGMTSKEGNHQRARFLAHTGYSPNPTVAHPALGAWVSARRAGEAADLPAFVSVGGPSEGGGFLGLSRAPFVVLDPSAPPANVRPARRVDGARGEARREALGLLEARFAAETGDAKIAARRAVYEQAARLMRSPRLDAFDLASEPDRVKQAYGDSDFGRGCLLARRLVEAGVKYVEVQLDGWDTHKDGFSRQERLLAQLDPAAATLLADLDARRLLDRTLVVAMGEFGRTPAINADDGRDHHPKAWSVLVAGGGVRGGVVHGRTDADGDAVVEGATSVPDLFATLATLLGLDPAETVGTRSGRPVSLTDGGRPIQAILR